MSCSNDSVLLLSIWWAQCIHMCTWNVPTVILFWVSVPVLSEQMTDVLPRVSTASSFRTRQFLTFACWAVNVRQTCSRMVQGNSQHRMFTSHLAVIQEGCVSGSKVHATLSILSSHPRTLVPYWWKGHASYSEDQQLWNLSSTWIHIVMTQAQPSCKLCYWNSSLTVTVARRPSGTLATIIPIRKTIARTQW